MLHLDDAHVGFRVAEYKAACLGEHCGIDISHSAGFEIQCLGAEGLVCVLLQIFGVDDHDEARSAVGGLVLRSAGGQGEEEQKGDEECCKSFHVERISLQRQRSPESLRSALWIFRYFITLTR